MSLLDVSHRSPHVIPLAVTPSVDPRESAIGYSLRLCEANGYPSTNIFLKETKLLSHSEQNLGGTADFLTAITLMDSSTAQRLAIRKAEDYSYYLLCQRLPIRDLNLYHHRICPTCVHTDGIHDASWQLSLVTHCPIHRIRLVDSCSRCNYSYRIHRPSTSLCRCNAPVTPLSASPLCSSQVAALFSTVRAKLFNDVTIAVTPNEFSNYAHVSLPTFLSLVNAMCNFVSKEINRSLAPWKPRTTKASAVEVVALALTQLSQGIDVMYGTLRGKAVAVDEIVRGAFSWFKSPYYGFSKNKELFFMNHLIDEFIDSHKGQMLPAKSYKAAIKRYSPGFLSRWVLVEDAGGLTNFDGENVRKIARLKLLTWMKGPRNRFFVSRKEVLLLQHSARFGLDSYQAAELAGIPVELFKRLSRSRIYIAQFIPEHGGPYSQEDVLQLRGLIERARPLVIDEVGQTVEAFLRRTSKSMLNFTRPLIDTLEGGR